MSIFDLIPTSDNLMSVYTLVALSIVATSTLDRPCGAGQINGDA
jgi:hypothetical protein